MATAEPIEKTNRGAVGAQARSTLLLLTLLLSYGLANGLVVLLVNVHHDEGWYLYASNLVYQGQRPYRDFAYFQMPLLPYIYGLFQWLAGPSILVGRLTSLLFSLAAAGLSMLIARRLAGGLAAAITLLCLLTAGDFIRVGSYTNNVILGTFFALLGAYFFISSKDRALLAPLSAVAWSLAALTRLSFAPAAALSVLLILWQQRRNRGNVGLILIAITAVIGLSSGVELLTAFDEALFNILTAQLDRQNQLIVAASTASVAGPGAIFLTSLLSYLPALLLAGLIGAFYLGKAASILQRRPTLNILYIALLGPIIYLPNLVPGDVYPTYMASAYPFLALVAGLLMHRAHRIRLISPNILAGLAATILLTSGVLSFLYLSLITSRQPSGLAQLQAVTHLVHELTLPQSNVLTFETSLAVNANRRVTEGTTMSYFSYFPKLDTALARQHHVVNEEIISNQIKQRQVGLIALTDFDIHLLRDPQNSSRARPQPLTWPELKQYFPELEGRYELVAVISDYGEWHTHLYLLRPLAQADG